MIKKCPTVNNMQEELENGGLVYKSGQVYLSIHGLSTFSITFLYFHFFIFLRVPCKHSNKHIYIYMYFEV